MRCGIVTLPMMSLMLLSMRPTMLGLLLLEALGTGTGLKGTTTGTVVAAGAGVVVAAGVVVGAGADVAGVTRLRCGPCARTPVRREHQQVLSLGFRDDGHERGMGVARNCLSRLRCGPCMRALGNT